MPAWIRVAIAGVCTVVAVVHLAGCSDPGGDFKENQPPTVWLSGAPPSGTVESYTIKMFWGGWDPDGEIQYYEYCITDNEGGTFDPADTVGPDKWHRVYSNDSTFSFTADELVDTNTTDLVTEFRRSHTFFIRAVDMEGLPSRTPEYRSFTAFTLSPEVRILIPPKGSIGPAQVPPITTYRWTAIDYISDDRLSQDPDSISHLLEPLTSHHNDWGEAIEWIRDLPVDAPEWGSWKWYGAPEDSGKTWTTPPKELGKYVFVVRAKDEAGAITPVFDERFNLRRVNVTHKRTGPHLTVRNQYLGAKQTWVCSEPLTILDIFAGVPLKFSWEADASSYGGTVVGYRYGWDITNLEDPEEWEVPFTPFPPHPNDPVARSSSKARPLYVGTHVFTVEVKDNSDYCSRIEVKVNIVQFTMTRGLLIVDDYEEPDPGGWNDPIGKGLEPTDQQHDEFWVSMASNIGRFDPRLDVEDVTGTLSEGVPLAKLANYKSIVWSVRGGIASDRSQALPQLVRYRPKAGESHAGKQQANAVSLFMAAGGHLLICGYQPLSMVVDRTYGSGVLYPLIWKYEIDSGIQSQKPPLKDDVKADPPGDETFAYLDMCVETMDVALQNFTIRRDGGVYCSVAGVGLRRIPPGEALEYKRTRSMRAAIPLDQTFPRLELRPETAGPGKAHAPEKEGLDVEVYNPQYFFDSCNEDEDMSPVVLESRDCFEPIYGLGCLYTDEPTFEQPVAFWTSTFDTVLAEAPGAVRARSALFGFQPVLCDTTSIRDALEHIFFDEWRLPRK